MFYYFEMNRTVAIFACSARREMLASDWGVLVQSTRKAFVFHSFGEACKKNCTISSTHDDVPLEVCGV